MKKHSHYKKKKAEKKRKDGPFGWCEGCKKWFPKADLIVGPDPFRSEICNDDTPTSQCKDCYRESCWDI